MPGTRKLGRPTDHRKAMLRGMVTHLLENGRIETTVTRAKEVRAMTEKMITLGKENTLASRTIPFIQEDRHFPISQRKMLLRSFLMRLLLSMQTETVVTAVLSKQAPVAAMQQKCASLSLFKII